ncbi:MAG TPA: sulfur carrier protein ThiS [Bacteroidia bacterium]|jgi:sulfur carrier protein|nr:sulfur carrier protein ThiS [Bacteroidia bacterium]
MEVIINHNKTELKEKSSLFILLQLQDLSEKKGIAVAVNNKVVPRSKWNSHILNSNDSITIIKATQGG